MTRTRIIIDTDPGQDDAVAILLALAERDRLDLLGIVSHRKGSELENFGNVEGVGYRHTAGIGDSERPVQHVVDCLR